MEAIRKIIDAQHLLTIIDLPEHMKDGRVELIILPIAESEPRVSATKSMKGFLREYANPSLAEQEKEAWGRVAADKHVRSGHS
jgi:hypothetical protein